MSPSILERVTHRPPTAPASFHPLDVAARWKAMRTLYVATRNRERAR